MDDMMAFTVVFDILKINKVHRRTSTISVVRRQSVCVCVCVNNAEVSILPYLHTHTVCRRQRKDVTEIFAEGLRQIYVYGGKQRENKE